MGSVRARKIGQRETNTCSMPAPFHAAPAIGRLYIEPSSKRGKFKIPHFGTVSQFLRSHYLERVWGNFALAKGLRKPLPPQKQKSKKPTWPESGGSKRRTRGGVRRWGACPRGHCMASSGTQARGAKDNSTSTTEGAWLG